MANTRKIRDRIYGVSTRQSGVCDTVLHPLKSRDGLHLSLSQLVHEDPVGTVLLIHGLTTSSDMYVMPEHYGLAAFLHDRGYDVWMADFRMSSHFDYNIEHRFNFDDVGLNDWPVIVDYIQAHSRVSGLHVVAHCLGSATFCHALYGAGLAGIQSFVSNSVSLTPRVHLWTKLKVAVSPEAVEMVLGKGFIDPNWAAYSKEDQPWLGRQIAKLTGLYHLECNSSACNLLSFLWGSGHPAMYEHENMHEVTHARLTELFGPVGMEYFKNMRAALYGGQAFGRFGKGEKYANLPTKYIDNASKVQVPTLLMSGDRNNIFPGSNRLTYERLRAKGLDGYEYRELAGYGHQDVFMGKSSCEDVFPIVYDFLRRNAG